MERRIPTRRLTSALGVPRQSLEYWNISGYIPSPTAFLGPGKDALWSWSEALGVIAVFTLRAEGAPLPVAAELSRRLVHEIWNLVLRRAREVGGMVEDADLFRRVAMDLKSNLRSCYVLTTTSREPLLLLNFAGTAPPNQSTVAVIIQFLRLRILPASEDAEASDDSQWMEHEPDLAVAGRIVRLVPIDKGVGPEGQTRYRALKDSPEDILSMGAPVPGEETEPFTTVWLEVKPTDAYIPYYWESADTWWAAAWPAILKTLELFEEGEQREA